MSESVKCRFSKCRFSVLNLKFDFISDGGCTREKQIQKALGSLPPCGNRCRFSESAICSSRVHPPSDIKSNFKFKTLRWRPLRWRLTLSEYGKILKEQLRQEKIRKSSDCAYYNAHGYCLGKGTSLSSQAHKAPYDYKHCRVAMSPNRKPRRCPLPKFAWNHCFRNNHSSL